MRYFSSLLPIALVTTVSLSATPVTYAAEDSSFVLRDVRVEGLVRLLPAEAYGLLPIAGDTITPSVITDSIKKMMASGNFKNVTPYREGNVLTFKVIESPTISAVTFSGNKSIPSDALTKVMKSAGIFEGDILKPSVLHHFVTDLQQQYTLQGRYNATVDVKQTAKPNNRVDLVLKVVEGDATKITDINITGNKAIDEDDIRRAMLVKQHSWTSFLSSKDVYAREQMTASVENVKALYLNKGYLKVAVDEPKTTISADKKKITIALNIHEGSQYTFSGSSFSGNLIFPEAQLQPLVTFKPKQMFSQTAILDTNQQLNHLYSNSGYFSVEINPVPEINETDKTVKVNYLINPGSQVFVRRISFVGNNTTADKVLRQELRQMEGALASTDKINLSKQRLERSGYFKTVSVETAKVPNSNDQIDLLFRVEEDRTGSTNVAVGYSQSGGVTFQFGLNEANFMGSGKSVSLSLDRSQTAENYSINLFNPFYTPDGVTQGYSIYSHKTKTDPRNLSSWLVNSLGGSLSYGYPLNEDENVNAEFNIDRTNVTSSEKKATINVVDFLASHKGTVIPSTASLVTDSVTGISTPQLNNDGYYEGQYVTGNINLGWAYNTLNRPVFPTKGIKNTIQLSTTLPGSQLNYQRAILSTQAYYPLNDSFVLRGYGKLGIGNNLPFYKNFFAGGLGSVRGYRDSTLGPRSATKLNPDLAYADQEAVGGSAMTQLGSEFIFPLPFKGDWTQKIRPVLFVEGAQVYDKANDMKLNGMRYGAGIGFTWMTVIGPISFTYAKALNAKEGDQTKTTQFDIGRVF